MHRPTRAGHKIYMRKVAVCLVLLIGLGSAAFAEPQFLPILKKAYNFPVGSDADKAGCRNCHTKPPERNPFGKAVEAAMNTAKLDTPTAALFKSIENLDSDGDGYTNGEELKAGFNPGDPNSHPASHATAQSDASSGGASGDPLVPKHTFHPALVHFPIALFLFGVALELLAFWKKQAQIREAAFWNFVGAALSTAVVVPTGVIASFRLGMALTPGKPVFTHLLVASSATIGMIAVAVWQKKSRPVGAGYWALILLTAALVAAAGYFGGELVY